MRRLLLAVLLTRANRPVSAHLLAEVLWAEKRPANPGNSLSLHIHRLRQVMDRPERISAAANGYQLNVGEHELDSAQFGQLLDEARHLRDDDDLESATTRFREALALWRGAPFADVDDGQVIAPEARRLAEARLVAREELYDVELARGQAREIVPELTEIVSEYPLRERFTAQLMISLYRAGRRARALAAYRAMHRRLAAELQTEPGRDVRELYAAIEAEDDSLIFPGSGIRSTAATANVQHRSVTPGQLPPTSGAFVGRVSELEDLATNTDGAGPVMVSGMAGVGKTELALRFAHHVADRFGDGQLYLDLRGHATAPALDPAEALARLLRSLGTDLERIPGTVEEATAEYRSRLANRKMLVLLDNAASADQVRPLLAATPGCLTLVTSRSRLSGLVARDGAHRIELGVLPSSDGLALLTQLLGRQRVAAEPNEAAALVVECGGLPLALRIVAAQLVDQAHSTLADHLADFREDGLTTLAFDDDEHSAVEAAFHLSYQRLGSDTRRMFRLLGLAPGADIALGAAASLSGMPLTQARATLRRLVNVHLVHEYDVDRFRLHDLLRDYAQQRAETEESAADRRDALERLFTWYYQGKEAAVRFLTTRRREPPRPALARAVPEVTIVDHRSGTAWLRNEIHNLTTAARLATEIDDAAPWAWHLVLGAVIPISRCGHMAGALKASRRALETARAIGDRHAIAHALTEFAAVRALAGVHVPEDFHHEVLDHADSVGDRFVEGHCLYVAGVILGRQDQVDASIDCLTRALAVQRATGDEGGRAWTLNYLGSTALSRGDLRRAVHWWEDILKLSHSPATVSAYINLSLTLPMLGRLGGMDQLMNRAQALIDQEDNRPAVCVLTMSRAQWSRTSGRLHEALEFAQDAERLAAELGIPRLQADVGAECGHCHLALGDPDGAARAFENALEVARSAGLRDESSRPMHGLAETELAVGRPAAAKSLAEKALELAGNERRLLFADGSVTLARAELALGNVEDAIAVGERALSLERAVGHVLGEASALQLLAEAYSASKDPARNASASGCADDAQRILAMFG
jgi:DNA-binding SARP family transcriptional activator